MKVSRRSTPFGSESRTRVLILLHLLGSTYARELSRLLAQPVSVLQKALISLERDGLVAAQTVGRTRLFRLNPGYFARQEFAAYLSKLAETDDTLRRLAAKIRRRPRRTGKPM